jgi:hypothetical protein
MVSNGELGMLTGGYTGEETGWKGQCSDRQLRDLKGIPGNINEAVVSGRSKECAIKNGAVGTRVTGM